MTTTVHTPISATFDAVADRIAQDPSAAIARFEVHSRQIAGLHSEVEAGDFLLTVDEPAAHGGQGLGPNPVQLILAAIASCQEITYRLYADRLGIPLRGVAVSVAGDIDLRGLFALDAGTRPGLRGLDIRVDLDSDADPERLDYLKRTVDAHCPVLDIIRNATPVSARRVSETDSGPTETPFLAGLAG